MITGYENGGWPVIIFSRIVFLGESFDVFSFNEKQEDITKFLDKRDKNVKAVFLYPSEKADVSIESYLSNGEKFYGYELSSIAASIFITEVRGLPLDEVSVETPCGIFEIKRVGSLLKYGIVLEKCKLIYTNKPVYVDEIEALVTAFSYKNNIYRATKCENLSLFDTNYLNSLLLSNGEGCIDGAIVYSQEGNNIDMRCCFIDERPSDVIYSAIGVAQLVPKKDNGLINIAHSPRSRLFVMFCDGRAVLGVNDYEVYTLFSGER